MLVLRNPVALIIMAHYVSILMLNAIPRHLQSSKFALYAMWGHLCVHGIYTGLFASSAKTRNVALYIAYWIRYYAFVPAFHYILYMAYRRNYHEVGYVADLWLGAYWYAHVQVLHMINERLLL